MEQNQVFGRYDIDFKGNFAQIKKYFMYLECNNIPKFESDINFSSFLSGNQLQRTPSSLPAMTKPID